MCFSGERNAETGEIGAERIDGQDAVATGDKKAEEADRKEQSTRHQ